MKTLNMLKHQAARSTAAACCLALALLCAMAAGPTLAEEESKTPPMVAEVNINTADAATLARQLSGVGLSRAEEIIRYREAYGPFAAIEELSEVKGIGPATLERNRALITLE